MDNAGIIAGNFKKLYDQLQNEDIKETVDDIGIDAFIDKCARYAAMSGAAAGFAGFATMVVGVPLDVVNNVFQQFRVTLAVLYHKKGIYKPSFAEFMTIVGLSVGVEVGATIGKSVMIAIARQILVRMTASTAGKAIPFFGAVIGGSVNYGFIKLIGTSVKQLNMDSVGA